MAKKRKARKKGRHSPLARAAKAAGKPAHDANDVIARLEKLHENRKVEFSKPPYRIIYWTSLLVLLVCNFVISIVLVPFMLVLGDFKFYLLVMLLGLIFGFLFSILINDIEHIELKHHAFAIILIPVVAVINIFVMVGLANGFARVLRIYTYHNPALPALLYSIVFVLPYVISIVKNYGKKGEAAN